MVVVPMTLVGAAGIRAQTPLASSGVLSLAMRSGKLLEARWFPDDVALEDAYFGGEPQSDGPSPAEAAFEQAARDVKTLAKTPDNDSLLALYALFKQASVGDVTGERPGLLDQIGRAKYDAWANRRGMSADEAMTAYVDLVTRLKQSPRS
jgi:carboxylesterase